MFKYDEESYVVVENLLVNAKLGDNDAMADLIERLEPLIATSCRHYFGYVDEDLMQQGRLRCIILVRSFDLLRGIRFLGYMKTMVGCYFWDLKKDHIKLAENEMPMTQDSEDYIKSRSFLDLAYADVEIYDLLLILTKKERYIILKNVIGQEMLAKVARDMGISYSYAKDLKNAALSKLRKTLVVN